MFKLIKFVYSMGREKAYAEIVAELRLLVADLPPTREGQLLKDPVDRTIKRLKERLECEELYNGTDN